MSIEKNNDVEAQRIARTERVGNAIAISLCLLVCLTPEFAHAAGGNPIQRFLDAVIAFLTNGVMRSVAILAVISMGVAAYLGRVSWELAMKVGAGIILTFGAAALVDQFSGYVV